METVLKMFPRMYGIYLLPCVLYWSTSHKSNPEQLQRASQGMKSIQCKIVALKNGLNQLINDHGSCHDGRIRSLFFAAHHTDRMICVELMKETPPPLKQLWLLVDPFSIVTSVPIHSLYHLRPYQSQRCTSSIHWPYCVLLRWSLLDVVV
jgi:hypothetical protein